MNDESRGSHADPRHDEAPAPPPVTPVSNSTRGDIERLLAALQGDARRAQVAPALERALGQARRAGDDPLGFSDAVSHEDEYYLALVRAARGDAELHPAEGLPYDLVGLDEFELLDVRWVGSLIEMLSSEPMPFPTHASLGIEPVVRIADKVRIVMAGDWGTGNESSRQIARQMAERNPDHTIHLGDVYYAGTPDEVRGRFLAAWPGGSAAGKASFALNSNHEMYAGGRGYFKWILTDHRFAAQRGLSYFALENEHWTLVAFDSAYHSHRRSLYQHGSLDAMQAEFIRTTARRAREAGRRVLALCHHHGINTKGEFLRPWWDTVIDAFDGGPDGWYFGHEHAAAAYAPVVTPGGVTVRARCVGHGGVPYAPIAKPSAEAEIEWCEDTLAGDPTERRRARNGFLTLELDGASLRETFVDEFGNERWTSAW